MLDGILEENKLGFLGEGHVVIIQVVLENGLNPFHVRQVLIQTVFFLGSHLQGNVRRCFRVTVEIKFLGPYQQFHVQNLTLMKSPNIIGSVTKHEGSIVIEKYLPGRKRERRSKRGAFVK